MKSIKVAALALSIGSILGGAIGFTAQHWLGDTTHTTEHAQESNEPLYWVAPMDPNYKRDKPGKSPMGMDLIPVFAEDDTAQHCLLYTSDAADE